MLRKPFPLICLACFFAAQTAMAEADKFRLIWQDDPSSSVVIGWNQVSGERPTLHLDINDYGKNASEYGLVKNPDKITQAKGMNNHFVHLRGLIPNTTYYFIIKDSEGLSRRLFFTTAPNSSKTRLSIIAGGDSRNHRDARRDANLLVAKLRPHCVMFGGDFTENDTALEWLDWFEDWQLTISEDGRMTPIVPARGNHEASNQSLVDVFDMSMKDMYFAISIGGNLARIYTLNSMMPANGNQRDWLEGDLRQNNTSMWKLAQYHHPIRPHTRGKSEKNDQAVNWCPLFLKYNVSLAVECDAHVVKTTYPIRLDNGPGSDEGFIRDNGAGTVYIGEGCWGAPLRLNNDDKSWTRASDSFNQFNWIFIDEEKIEVRVVQTDGAERVASVEPNNIFRTPKGLSVWSPPTGDVIYIEKNAAVVPTQNHEELITPRVGFEEGGTPQKKVLDNPQPNEKDEMKNWEICPQLSSSGKNDLVLKYEVEAPCTIVIRLINLKLQEVIRLELPNQQPGEFLKAVNMERVPPGRYLAIVKGNRKVLQRYRVWKRE